MDVKGEIICKVSEILKKYYPDLGALVSIGDIAVILFVFSEVQSANSQKLVQEPISDSGSQEIGEAETPIMPGNDSAIERCPTEGYD